MRYFKIVFFILTFTLMSCGKPPIFNKADKVINQISTDTSLSEKLPQIDNSFSFNWVIAPTLNDLSSFDITLEKPLTNNQTISAYLWMPDMGHGSSPIVIEEVDSTHYKFSELAFIMPGLWVLHIEILDNNQVSDQWQTSITL